TVDGNWGEWSDFSDCSTTCDGGTQNRTRLCDNPEPSNDGATCPPPGSETSSCNPVSFDGDWGNWGEFSNCTKTCGNGTRTRQRLCDNPSPAHGGATCLGNQTE
ncbi:hypothetical protein LOTGIDRAFT_66885, partial [Lottia gigantea]